MKRSPNYHERCEPFPNENTFAGGLLVGSFTAPFTFAGRNVTAFLASPTSFQQPTTFSSARAYYSIAILVCFATSLLSRFSREDPSSESYRKR